MAREAADARLFTVSIVLKYVSLLKVTQILKVYVCRIGGRFKGILSFAQVQLMEEVEWEELAVLGNSFLWGRQEGRR
jgi:hypothetical protein